MPIANDCGGIDLANASYTSLSSDTTFTLPSVDLSDAVFSLPSTANNDLYGDVTKLDCKALTSGVVDGSGMFDCLMSSIKAHLGDEYEKGRITGEQYTRAYIENTNAALSTATQYLLSKDQSYWQALLLRSQGQAAEAASITAKVQLEISKAQLANQYYDVQTAKSNYTLTKMKLSTEGATFCTQKAQEAQIKYQTDNILPNQKNLLLEQIEAQRAQTMDTRVDGVTTIAGSIGKQKELHAQQITSFQQDSKYKIAKMYLDGWTVQKTMDEGLLAPTELTNTEINKVLSKVRTNNGLT